MKTRNYFFALYSLLIFNFEVVWTQSSVKGIENSPRILSNHDLNQNSLRESVYELLANAQSSILIFSFTFSDLKIIEIINEKAKQGIHVQLVIDRDHLSEFKSQLHPLVQLNTRVKGEGHLHHKILVVDGEYVWLGSANFTPGGFSAAKNLAIGFDSKAIGAQLHKEAIDSAAGQKRTGTMPHSCSYGSQILELYILPHNDPKAPQPAETSMNETGKQKLISLIDTAQHHIKISVDSITYKDAARSIINAVQRGVKVDIVVGDITSEAVKMMTYAGIKVQQIKNLHYKFMLVDHKILLNGSLNWSMNAFSRSDESFIVIYDLTQEQMQAIEGSLQAAGLPIDIHMNKMVESRKDDIVEDVLTYKDVHKGVERINQTIAALNDEINKTPNSLEDQRLRAIAKRLSTNLATIIADNIAAKDATCSIPGCCLFNGDNYLFNVVAIAEKQERVQSALNYIKNVGRVDEKIIDYFLKTLQKLKSGINVALPDYFHATTSGLESIIASKTILQSKTGVTGAGTYVSCNNEGDHGYGNHTFAIDERCLVDTYGTFRTGRHPISNVFFSLWVSVLRDIPVSEDCIAFIDTSVDDIAYVKALLEKQNLNIHVVSREIADAILKIFDMTTKRRELASFLWKKFDLHDYLPKNMYPRSQQGTFRRFNFMGDAYAL